MHHGITLPLAFIALLTSGKPVIDPDILALSAEDSAAAAADYQKYCALCHGDDRQGYANDRAPSLRSESLIRSGFPTYLLYAVGYGRHGTPMGGYFEEVGGPLSREELYRLLRWLKERVGVEPIELSAEPVSGDIALGEKTYARICATCHGENGEGGVGPAIGNPSMLSLTPDEFLKYAIENGRDGTEMPAFAGTLPEEEINAVTAFLRSRATGWTVEKPLMRSIPRAGEYILNPGSLPPDFELKDGLYVKSEDLHRALQEKRRMVVLDTRVTSMWQRAHIEGAVPIPYYFEDFDRIANELPADGTWIVTYCQCPRASAEFVNQKLRERGYRNTAVLWEGIQGWVSLGYPVSIGQSRAPESTP